MKNWTDAEDAYLMEHYRNTPIEDMITVLGRSKHSIRVRAVRIRAVIPDPVYKEPYIHDDLCFVPLSSNKYPGLVAVADADKIDILRCHRWYPTKYRRLYYAVSHRPGMAKLRMHNLISGYKYVDHRDGNGLNNKMSNLRSYDRSSQNCANRPKSVGAFSSRFKGVTWNKKNSKWVAQIGVKWKQLYIGSFLIEEEAARAYDKAAFEAWGEFAHLNFPEDYPEHEAAVTYHLESS